MVIFKLVEDLLNSEGLQLIMLGHMSDQQFIRTFYALSPFTHTHTHTHTYIMLCLYVSPNSATPLTVIYFGLDILSCLCKLSQIFSLFLDSSGTLRLWPQ